MRFSCWNGCKPDLPLILSFYKNQGRVSKRALYCLLGLLAFVPVAQAESVQFTPQQISDYQATPESERVRLLIELSKTGHQDEAEALLKKFPLQGPHGANRTLYVQGLIMEARHDLIGAARSFRYALASDPKLTLVRSDLVQVLMQLDESDSAKHHLKLLQADAPSAEQAANIRSFIDKIDESHPYYFSGFINIAPSTNINSGSSHNTVYSAITGSNWDIAAANKAQSGLGITAGLNAGYSKRLGNNFQGVLAANIATSLYGDYAFDSISTSESGEMRYLLDQGFVSVGAVFSQVTLAQSALKDRWSSMSNTSLRRIQQPLLIRMRCRVPRFQQEQNGSHAQGTNGIWSFCKRTVRSRSATATVRARWRTSVTASWPTL